MKMNQLFLLNHKHNGQTAESYSGRSFQWIQNIKHKECSLIPKWMSLWIWFILLNQTCAVYKPLEAYISIVIDLLLKTYILIVLTVMVYT